MVSTVASRTRGVDGKIRKREKPVKVMLRSSLILLLSEPTNVRPPASCCDHPSHLLLLTPLPPDGIIGGREHGVSEWVDFPTKHRKLNPR